MDGARYGQAAIASASFTFGVATVFVVNVVIDFSCLSAIFTNSVRTQMARAFHNFANKLSAGEYPEKQGHCATSFEDRNPEFEQDMKFGHK